MMMMMMLGYFDGMTAIDCTTMIALTILKGFFIGIVCICIWNIRQLLLQWHGIQHRITGFIHLSLLIYGTYNIISVTDDDN